MRALLQRVSKASVSTEGEAFRSIGIGLVVLVAIRKDDDEEDANYIVNKTVNMRLFPDQRGKVNHSALEINGELLIVSQFSLYADTRKGRRPSFIASASPEQAEVLFHRTIQLFNQFGLIVKQGWFQSHMNLDLINDGPMTIMLDSVERTSYRKL